MKQIFYSVIFSLISIVTTLAQPAITGVLVPQFIADNLLGTGEGSRTPYVFRAKLTGLTAGATYRFRVQAICLSYVNAGNPSSDGATTSGAGNQIFIRQSGNFGYSSSASLATAGGYDSIVTNALGEYEGWFAIEPTTNARFTSGNYIHARIITNSGVTGNSTSTNYLTMTDSTKAISYSSNASQGTGVWSKSQAADKNISVLWDNIFGTGRPLSCAIIENDGVAFRSATTPTNYPFYYRNNVDSFSGAWGTIIPNSNANGVRRIENRKLTDGSIYYANLDADGIWPTGGISTINPSGGFTAIKLDSSDVPLIPMPTFYFDQTAYSVNESGTSVTVAVKYKNPTFTNTSVDVSVKAGGTATLGTDYTFTPATLTFAPTDTIKTITIIITNDIIVEGNETFILKLSNPTNSGLLRADSLTTVTIIDDDLIAPVFYFEQTAYSIGESGSTVTIGVKYNNPASISTNVEVSVKAGGTATAGFDYTFTSTTLNFSPTDTIQTISIPITNDILVEGNETFILRLSNQTNGCILNADSLTTITIIDDDLPPPVVSFSVAKQSVSEGAGGATITVKLSSPATTASSVSLTATNATATAPDYSFTATTLNFAVGDSVKTATATIIDDAIIEGNEYFIMNLSSPVNVTPGLAIDTVTITDNDYPRYPIGQIAAVNAGTGVADSLGKKYDEAGIVYGINYRPAGLQFVLRDNTGGITVFKTTGNYGYTVKEGDSIRVLGTVSQFNGLTEFNADTLFLLGTNKAIKAPTVITKLVEANENDLVRINNVQFNAPITTWPTTATNISVHNATDTIVIRIQLANADILGKPAPLGYFDIIGLGSQFDNTNPYTSGYQLFPRFLSDIISNTTNAVITVDAQPVSVNEGVGTVKIKLKINSVNGFASTVNIANTGTATPGADYISPSFITFPASSSNGDSIMVAYTIIDDALIESNETIVATLTGGSNATVVGPAAKTITIVDNDAPATLVISPGTMSVNENAGTIKVKVKISNVNGNATTATLALTGTATTGSDYTAPASSISFPANAMNGDSILISFIIIDDIVYEPAPETIITTFTAGANGVINGSAVQTITIVDNDPNGMNVNYKTTDVDVYPNPSNGELTIRSNDELLNIKLFDLLGNEVMVVLSNSNTASIKDMATGLYLIVIQTNKGSATQRVLIR